MSRAVLSLGSNLGDRLAALRGALAGLGRAVVAVSPVFETAPEGPVAQADFLNAVVLVDDPGTDARGWLALAQRLEHAAGRERGVRWGPRTLDVDVVTVTEGAVPGGAVPGEAVAGDVAATDVAAGGAVPGHAAAGEAVAGDAVGRPVLSADPDLTLPHPRAHERTFVLVPWLAVDRGAVLPGRGRVADLLAGLSPADRDGVRLSPDRLERAHR